MSGGFEMNPRRFHRRQLERLVPERTRTGKRESRFVIVHDLEELESRHPGHSGGRG